MTLSALIGHCFPMSGQPAFGFSRVAYGWFSGGPYFSTCLWYGATLSLKLLFIIWYQVHFRSVIFSALFFFHFGPIGSKCAYRALLSVSVKPVTRMFSRVAGCIHSISFGFNRKHCNTLVLLNFFAIAFGKYLPFGDGFVVRSASLRCRMLTGMCRLNFLKAASFCGALVASQSASIRSCSAWYSSVIIIAVL